MPEFTFATEPKVVVTALRPILLPIYEAFEIAVPKVHKMILDNAWPKTGTFSSHIVRAEVWALLQGKNCPVEFDDVPRVMTMGQVANEGLATRFNDIDIKINKGELLPAATTDARKLFYQHQDWNLWVNSIIPEIKSLVVLWDCDVNGNNLKLYLVCPKNAKGDWEWQERIPHPAEWLVIPPTDVLPPTSSGGDLDELVPITTEKEIKG